MCHLPHWYKQQQHLMQRMHSLGAQEVQWAQAPLRGPKLRQGTAPPIDRRPQEEVQVVSDKLEVVASFCYLGDMFFAAGGCELSTTTRVKTERKKFNELLLVLLSRHLFYKTRGLVYSSCFRNARLHASEIWPMTSLGLQRLRRINRVIIRQICKAMPEDVVTDRSNKLLAQLEIDYLDVILGEKVRWFGNVERFSGAIKTVCDMQIEGKHGPWKPNVTLRTVREIYHREWKLNEVDPCHRDV